MCIRDRHSTIKLCTVGFESWKTKCGRVVLHDYNEKTAQWTFLKKCSLLKEVHLVFLTLRFVNFDPKLRTKKDKNKKKVTDPLFCTVMKNNPAKFIFQLSKPIVQKWFRCKRNHIRKMIIFGIFVPKWANNGPEVGLICVMESFCFWKATSNVEHDL